jgi:hypothetical protein
VKPCKLAPHSGNSGMLASHYFLFNILSLFSLFLSLFSLSSLDLSLSHPHTHTHTHTSGTRWSPVNRTCWEH